MGPGSGQSGQCDLTDAHYPRTPIPEEHNVQSMTMVKSGCRMWITEERTRILPAPQYLRSTNKETMKSECRVWGLGSGQGGTTKEIT